NSNCRRGKAPTTAWVPKIPVQAEKADTQHTPTGTASENGEIPIQPQSSLNSHEPHGDTEEHALQRDTLETGCSNSDENLASEDGNNIASAQCHLPAHDTHPEQQTHQIEDKEGFKSVRRRGKNKSKSQQNSEHHQDRPRRSKQLCP
ncbi:hypothetical protein Dimus_013122, partial [Dionaea muscipula]